MGIPVALIASLAMSAYQGIKGAQKESQAKAEAARAPKSVIPEAQKAALAEARNLAMGRSEAAVQAERSLSEAAATAAYRSERGATSAAQYQQAVSGAQAVEQRGIRNIQQMEAQDKTQRENVYINQLMQMAQTQFSVDESNKANAWNIEQSARAAGQQMQYGAVNSALAGVAMAYGDKEIGGGDNETVGDITSTTPSGPSSQAGTAASIGELTVKSGLNYMQSTAGSQMYQPPTTTQPIQPITQPIQNEIMLGGSNDAFSRLYGLSQVPYNINK